MIYLIHGQNGLATEERVALLRGELDPTRLSTSAIDVAVATIQDVQSALMAAPFFGGKRLVILRGPASLTRRMSDADDNDDDEEDDAAPPDNGTRRIDWRDLAGVLPSIPPTTDVICWISGTLPSNHILAKTGREHDWRNEAHRIPRGAELMAWVSARASGNGATIAPDAVESLLDLLYPTSWRGEVRWETASINMRSIASEIEKLCCAASDGRIDAALVNELVADRGGYSAFRLTDHIFTGQVEASLQELDNVLSAGEAPEKVVGQLASELTMRWSIRNTFDLPLEQVAAALKTNERRVNTSRGKSAGSDPAALTAAAEAMRNADWAIKTGRSRDTSSTIVPLVAILATLFARRRATRPVR